ncbi:MAG: hypothetical protein GC153_04555 [Alphaproteobacteria bacterium]|nr:hypothetical protein [Alphaproteobacteria bacterium]
MTKTLKRIVAILLLATGALHVVVAYRDQSPQILSVQPALTIFGIVYFCLGLFAWPGGRTPILVAMVMSALGLGLGGQEYLRAGGPVSLLVMFAIDAAVLILGAAWLLRTQGVEKP